MVFGSLESNQRVRLWYVTHPHLQLPQNEAETDNKNAFGITIDPKMLSVHARRLPIPQVNYNGKKFVKPELADWNMRYKQFFQRIQISEWSYLSLCDQKLSAQSLGYLRQGLANSGMGEGTTKPHEGFHGNLPGYGDDDQNDKVIRDIMEEISKTKAKILLVVLPFKSKPIYARVKFWADVEFGMI